MHKPFLAIGVSFLFSIIFFTGLWCFPNFFIIFSAIAFIILIVYICFLFKNINKSFEIIKGISSTPYGNDGTSSQDDDKKTDGIDNPSDRRDVSDD